jgi:tetratricopeptide (TPR) repeat protein
MIHDHNKWRHAFYVEESYVIPWMYPYMEPHGLILKINAEPLPQLSPEVVKKDMEFWAWYKRRLLNNKKFLWDSVARKTFSKLRSAIAGLYEARGMVQQAEQAYLESVELCPISPEAHFRLTGLYMKMGRFQDAKGIMEQYQAQDSNNKNVPGTINNISNKINMFARKDELEALLKAGPQPVDKVIELARVYRDLGNNGGFVQVADNILSNAQVHPDALLDVAQLYMESGMPDRMAGALKAFFGRAPSGIPADRYQRIAQMYAQASMLPEASETLSQYLALRPMDVHALHELGVMYVFQKKLGEAMSCFQQAVRFAGDQARDDLVRDERLQEMRTRPEFRKLLSRM